MTQPAGIRLEQYTLLHPKEVLVVKAEIEGEPDEVSIFKGFSSSLMRSTAFDPDIPVLPEGAVIHAIDRLLAPYHPSQPHFIAQNLSWTDFVGLLEADEI